MSLFEQQCILTVGGFAPAPVPHTRDGTPRYGANQSDDGGTGGPDGNRVVARLKDARVPLNCLRQLKLPL
jgi:hypothetical protein